MDEGGTACIFPHKKVKSLMNVRGIDAGTYGEYLTVLVIVVNALAVCIFLLLVRWKNCSVKNVRTNRIYFIK